MLPHRHMSNPAKPASQQWPVIAFTVTYMSAAILTSLVTENMEFMLYVAVMIALIAVVAGIYARVGLSTAALWALAVWGGLHMAGGLIPIPPDLPIHGEIRVLYSLWLIPDQLKYDQVVHTYGFGVTTWVCWEVLARGLAVTGAQIRPTFGLMVLCAAAGLGFGALNEVIEFFATLLVPSTNVGGYDNTGWDLVANTVGAVFAASVIWIRGQT